MKANLSEMELGRRARLKIRGYQVLLRALLMFLPSPIKVVVLRWLGHTIHSTAYIGMSYMGVDHIVMGANTYIGHGNVFTSLRDLVMEEGARINRWNRVASGAMYYGVLHLRPRSALTMRHYLDVCDRIEVGSDTIIAGHRSSFFTHSKGVDVIDYTKPIYIGNWCYIGSNVCFAPGTHLGNGVFVGMGAVVAGDKGDENYCLLVGNPAVKRRDLDPAAEYFMQGPLEHGHTKGLYRRERNE